MATIKTSGLQRLIGTWKTTGEVSQDGTKLTLKGIDSYELILDGNFVLHKADVMMGDKQSQTLEIIGFNKTNGKANMQYFNNQGEAGAMSGMISGDDFQIDGDKIKFRGSIDASDSEIIGKWYLLNESDRWTEFINLKLERLS